jgi:hypothetical protein
MRGPNEEAYQLGPTKTAGSSGQAKTKPNNNTQAEQRGALQSRTRPAPASSHKNAQ